MECAHIYYSGTVQGVGFRFTTQRIAEEMDLKGWVRNLKDGRVEILAQGSKEQIERLCNDLDSHFHGYIRDKEIMVEEVQGRLRDFRIT